MITGLAAAVGLDDDATTHVLRHTFATTLVRRGTDLVIVAELLGHARLETTRGYTRPTEDQASPAGRSPEQIDDPPAVNAQQSARPASDIGDSRTPADDGSDDLGTAGVS